MEYTWEIIIFLILLGVLFGAINTMAGGGGGVLYVSFMVLFLGLAFDEARDTSIFILMFASGVAFFTYLKQGRTNLKLTLIFSVFAMLGSTLCWIFLIFFPINNEILRVIFGLIVIITAINMIYKTYLDKRNGVCSQNFDNCLNLKNYDYKKDLKTGIPFFIAAGIISRLLGIGGGIIFGPSLHIIFGFPIHYATSISNSVVFFTCLFNTVLLIFYGKINYFIGILLAIGSVFGAILGAKISNKMPTVSLQIFVALLLTFLGINMIFSIFTTA
ncbi:MAG: sulfite exporter TauE/SafE family protein [Promethearchaeota archaeon]|nr:MAG: sulfite exporter TauE/SafE family protein [Candidatus Lokiarchaeota archaeon]